MIRSPRLAGLLVGCFLSLAALAAETRFTVDDLVRIANIADLDLSPDGEYVVYSVGEPDFEADEPRYDVWRARWDGSERRPLTRTDDSDEWQPAFSPDGKRIAFLSDRGEEDAETQVWVMPADAGEAERLTEFPGGVVDFDWSPDGQQLAVIANDPERPADEEEPPKPPPIVIDRYQFKEDFIGLLTDKRQHLYLFEIEGRKATQLTRGQHDEYLPAWSPDGKRIAYVTKRGPDPDRHINWDVYVIEPREGADERQVTRFAGADLDPYWETRPAWSPDGKRIAYLQSGEDKWIYYKPWELAVVDVESGETRRPAGLDRNSGKPVFTPDGNSIITLVEESRVTHVSRVDLESGRVTRLTSGRRFDYDFDAAANGRIAVLGGDDHHPYRIEAIEPSKGTLTFASDVKVSVP
ncbi:MAG: TolB family protein, partial [Steroidobacteraceae bacterium]